MGRRVWGLMQLRAAVGMRSKVPKPASCTRLPCSKACHEQPVSVRANVPLNRRSASYLGDAHDNALVNLSGFEQRQVIVLGHASNQFG
jgi:hypothetical protein